MAKRLFTFSDIDTFLHDNLDCEWYGNLRYDLKTKKYVQAELGNFAHPVYIYLKNKVSTYLIRKVKINNETFQIFKNGKVQIDLSDDWKEYLLNKENTKNLNK